MPTIRIATRASKLATIQARAVAERIVARGATVEIIAVTTRGDLALDRSLAAIGGDGVFVKELEAALLDGRADVAVHSMKDLPTETTVGLCIGAVLEREDPRDVLISRDNAFANLAALPRGAIVGTSSVRRKAMLLSARPDACPRDIRGNVDTRVRKVLDGEYDAAILALAGMKRIGLLDAVGGGAPIPTDQMIPAVGQGAICAQCRTGDSATRSLLATIDHAPTALETAMERAVLARMGGGCVVPIGAHAVVRNGRFTLDVAVAASDGASVVRKSTSGDASPEVAAVAAAERVADELLAAGGRELIESFRAAIARES